MKTNKTLLKGIITVCIVIFSNQLQAQLKKGNWLFEGNLGNISFNDGNSKNESGSFKNESASNNFYFDFYPRAGYFLTDNFVLGSEIGFGFSSGTSESTNTIGVKTSESKNSSSYLTFGPFIRYYFPSSNQALRFYGQAGAGINMTLSNKSEGKSFNGTTGILSNEYSYNYPKKYNTFSASGAIGMHYFLSSTTALNSSIGYYYSKAKQTSNYTSTSGGIATTSDDSNYEYNNSRISWSIGFTVFLDNQKKE